MNKATATLTTLTAALIVINNVISPKFLGFGGTAILGIGILVILGYCIIKVWDN